MNKQITTLAAAILAASSAQAKFEVAFVAVDGEGDTYVRDLSLTAFSFAEGPYNMGFDGTDIYIVDDFWGWTYRYDVWPHFNGIDSPYTWTVVGANQSSNVLAAPPGASGFTAYEKTGLLTTSYGQPTGLNVANNQAVNNEMNGLQNWLSTVADLAYPGTYSVAIPASSADKYTAGQQVAFHAGRMQSGGGHFQLNTIFHSANANPLALPDINGEVPVPAAAWLFGSALAGIGVVRRKKQLGK